MNKEIIEENIKIAEKFNEVLSSKKKINMIGLVGDYGTGKTDFIAKYFSPKYSFEEQISEKDILEEKFEENNPITNITKFRNIRKEKWKIRILDTAILSSVEKEIDYFYDFYKFKNSAFIKHSIFDFLFVIILRIVFDFFKVFQDYFWVSNIIMFFIIIAGDIFFSLIKNFYKEKNFVTLKKIFNSKINIFLRKRNIFIVEDFNRVESSKRQRYLLLFKALSNDNNKFIIVDNKDFEEKNFEFSSKVYDLVIVKKMSNIVRKALENKYYQICNNLEFKNLNLNIFKNYIFYFENFRIINAFLDYIKEYNIKKVFHQYINWDHILILIYSFFFNSYIYGKLLEFSLQGDSLINNKKLIEFDYEQQKISNNNIFSKNDKEINIIKTKDSREAVYIDTLLFENEEFRNKNDYLFDLSFKLDKAQVEFFINPKEVNIFFSELQHIINYQKLDNNFFDKLSIFLDKYHNLYINRLSERMEKLLKEQLQNYSLNNIVSVEITKYTFEKVLGLLMHIKFLRVNDNLDNMSDIEVEEIIASLESLYIADNFESCNFKYILAIISKFRFIQLIWENNALLNSGILVNKNKIIKDFMIKHNLIKLEEGYLKVLKNNELMYLLFKSFMSYINEKNYIIVFNCIRKLFWNKFFYFKIILNFIFTLFNEYMKWKKLKNEKFLYKNDILLIKFKSIFNNICKSDMYVLNEVKSFYKQFKSEINFVYDNLNTLEKEEMMNFLEIFYELITENI
ncbi:hypothetical protein [Spiroplasma tabanidicola]|uniref:Uncharacterized protein n=1 Tax=Spiroplasma tabanidicola TaxID=324079 RepID=A0A6I6C9Y0_9MOLU|nr:hypothetical protein [Spiroplasma tabanidicola]QGS52259.1 hypothetical protein STABA_v1c09040 [Spiroplasma tabanidicola]